MGRQRGSGAGRGITGQYTKPQVRGMMRHLVTWADMGLRRLITRRSRVQIPPPPPTRCRGTSRTTTLGSSSMALVILVGSRVRRRGSSPSSVITRTSSRSPSRTTLVPAWARAIADVEQLAPVTQVTRPPLSMQVAAETGNSLQRHRGGRGGLGPGGEGLRPSASADGTVGAHGVVVVKMARRR